MEGSSDRVAAGLAIERRRHIFVRLAERGIVGATPKGKVEHLPALPVRGPIDFVGAGDSVRSWLDFDRNAAADSQD